MAGDNTAAVAPDQVKTIPEKDIVFILTRDEVVLCAQELGYPTEMITDDVLYQVKKGVEFGLECWTEVMREAVSFALKG